MAFSFSRCLQADFTNTFRMLKDLPAVAAAGDGVVVAAISKLLMAAGSSDGGAIEADRIAAWRDWVGRYCSRTAVLHGDDDDQQPAAGASRVVHLLR